MTLLGIRPSSQAIPPTRPIARKSTPTMIPEATISPAQRPSAMTTAPIAFIGSMGMGRR